MTKYIYISFISSFLITFITVPLVKKLAFKINILDIPSGTLKPHSKPIPYLGGVAILLGLIIPSLLFKEIFNSYNILFLNILMILFCFIGLIDDIYDISQNIKFLIILILSIIVSSFFRVNFIPYIYISIPLTVFYILGACNSLNLLDGMDGLASGVSLIISIFFFILFYLKQDVFGIVLSLSLAGSCLSFLFYNFNPASIFMGDAGSLLLGFVISILMIHYTKQPYNVKSFIVPILICGLPVFDTGTTYLRRYLNNKPIFPGERNHIYDKIFRKIKSTKKTVLLCYLLSILFGLAGIAVKYSNTITALFFIFFLLNFLVVLSVKLKLLKMTENL